MRCFKRAGFVIATMIMMILVFFIANVGNVTFIPVAAAQSASEEAARIAAEAAAKAKVAREKAEADRKEAEEKAKAAAKVAREKAEADRKEVEEKAKAAAKVAREKAEADRKEREEKEKAAAERKRIEAEAAAERARIEAEAAAERARIEAEAAAERAKKNFEASLSLNMVLVQGGTFTMGCTPEQGKDCDKNEKPAHQVTLSDFYIGKYEVTQAQWQKVMGKNPSSFKGDDLPVENVNWNDVQEFIKKLNEMTGGNYRLPTESEWEYAARGGSKSQGYKHSGSNNIRDVGWYAVNGEPRTYQVGTKRANELAIHDMSGNVWEWVHDRYGDYDSNPQTNPQGPSSGAKRVIRGGSWSNTASNVRVSGRRDVEPDLRNFDSLRGGFIRRGGGSGGTLGFRLARSSE